MKEPKPESGGELNLDELAGVSGGVDIKPPSIEPDRQPQADEDVGVIAERKGKPGRGVLN